jgi:ABC-2 type transporter
LYEENLKSLQESLAALENPKKGPPSQKKSWAGFKSGLLTQIASLTKRDTSSSFSKNNYTINTTTVVQDIELGPHQHQPDTNITEESSLTTNRNHSIDIHTSQQQHSLSTIDQQEQDDDDNDEERQVYAGGTSTPWWFALLVLWKYRSLKSYRTAAFIMPRTGDKIVIVFLVATIWWGAGDNALAASGILFLWSMLSAFSSMGILATLVIERPVFRRERADGLYNVAVYTIYKLSEEIAPQVPAGLIYSALVFYLVQLKGSFVLFWLVYLVSTANAIASTCLVSALSPNTSIAGAFMSTFATTLFFFSGYLIPYNDIPVYWRWYSTIDYLRYAFGAMMANQFHINDVDALIGGINALEFYDLETVDEWRWLGYQAIFFPVYSVLLWAALKFLKHTKR